MDNRECHFSSCRYNKDSQCTSENDYEVCFGVVRDVLGLAEDSDIFEIIKTYRLEK
jgi:hypothetical protein